MKRPGLIRNCNIWTKFFVENIHHISYKLRKRNTQDNTFYFSAE